MLATAWTGYSIRECPSRGPELRSYLGMSFHCVRLGQRSCIGCSDRPVRQAAPCSPFISSLHNFSFLKTVGLDVCRSSDDEQGRMKVYPT